MAPALETLVALAGSVQKPSSVYKLLQYMMARPEKRILSLQKHKLK